MSSIDLKIVEIPSGRFVELDELTNIGKAIILEKSIELKIEIEQEV